MSAPIIGVFGDGLVARRSSEFLERHDIEVRRFAMTRVAGVGDGGRISRIEPSHTRDLRVAITATSSMHQVYVARALVDQGISVVATADRPAAVRQLWRLGRQAESRGVSVVVGAAYAPGLTSLLVTHLASSLDTVDTITTARFGTGGPACAREHHRSMAAPALIVEDQAPKWVRGGSGRTLVWFPEPVGGQDCYRAGLAEPFLLQQAFPEARRIQALQAATRRDRLTAQLPMLRRPHAEGLVGSVWAEVRGRCGVRVEHRVLAALAPQATGAAAIAAAMARIVLQDGISPGPSTPAQFSDPRHILRELPAEVGLWAYDGSVAVPSGSNAPIRAARKWSRPQNPLQLSPIGRKPRASGTFA